MPDYAREPGHLLLTRVLLAQARPDAALLLLDRLYAAAAAQARAGSLIEIGAGRSNQAIASRLVVTLDTVKKHVSHVLSKLGAANRTEAVTRARQLGLIP